MALGGSRNFVLLDDADTPAEQRFSLAHEVAHFLLDYLQPREATRRKLGETALEVVDGLRPASLEERWPAALAKRDLAAQELEKPYLLHLVGRETANPEYPPRA